MLYQRSGMGTIGLTVGLLAMGVVGEPASVWGAQSLLTNGNFELDANNNSIPDGWTFFGGSTPPVEWTSTSHAVSPGHAVWLKTFSSSSGGLYQDRPAVAGADYTLSVPLYFESNFPATDHHIEVKLEWRTNGSTISSDSLQLNGPDDDLFNAYAVYDLTATAPVGATTVRSTVLFDTGTGAGTGARSVFVDDMSLTTNAPEPSAAGAMVVSATACLARRRRRN
jgi:hypothetical protein